MKTISNALAEHLAGEVTTLATCWKLTRRDNVVYGFTNHDRDLNIDGVGYLAASGFTPTAVMGSASLAVDNLDIEGMLQADSISEEAVMAGLFDFAEVEVFQVNYTNLAQGRLYLRRGWLGEVTLKNLQFVAELRGLSQRLSHMVGDYYSPACRASLGDARCAVNMETRTHGGTVTAAASRQRFSDSARTEASDTFTHGKLTFTSGANDGISMEVKEYVTGHILLALPMPYSIEAGDSYMIAEGCDRSFFTCCNRFSNAVNFRGEPHVPGTDRMLETAGTRSEWK